MNDAIKSFTVQLSFYDSSGTETEITLKEVWDFENMYRQNPNLIILSRPVFANMIIVDADFPNALSAEPPLKEQH